MCRVSVITTVYNLEKYVGETIEAILNQTYTDLELIVMDDCSTDGSGKVIQKYKDKRIRYIRNEKNQGLLYSLNYGLSVAVGDYVAITDGDDLSYPERIEKQVRYMDEHPEVALLGTWMDYVFDDRKEPRTYPPINGSKEIACSLLYVNCCMAHSSFMMRRSVLEEHHLRYEKFCFTQDFHMMHRILKYGTVDVLKEPLIAYRIHSSQATKRKAERLRKLETDLSRTMYADTLSLKKKYREIIKKAICRELCGRRELQLFTNAFLQYARTVGLDISKSARKKSACMKYLYRIMIVQQRHNLTLLACYLRSGMADKEWLHGEQGRSFVRRCMLRDNACWKGTVKVLWDKKASGG